MNRRQLLRTLGGGGTVASVARARDNQNAQSGGPPIHNRTGLDSHLRHHEFWISPNGNDANDGLSWQTAKRTILAAYDALPAEGGTIYFVSSTTIGPTGTEGLWLVGTGDPNYNTPPAGWRKAKKLRLVGVAAGDGFLAPQADLSGGSSTDPRKPLIWLAGTDVPFRLENANLKYPACAVTLGKNTTGGVAVASSSTVSFFNCTFHPANAAGTGPTILMDFVFWIWFDKCLISWNPHGSDLDHQVAILVKPTGPGSGLIHIVDCEMTGRAIRFYAGTSPMGLFLRNITIENTPANSNAIEIVGVQGPPGIGTMIFDHVELADAGANVNTLQIDGQLDPSVVTCIGTSGVAGPATIIGNQYTYCLANGSSGAGGAMSPGPTQIGFSANGIITGQHDSTRRAFGPAAVRFANLVADTSAWGGNATVTTGIAAPDGTRKAFRLSSGAGQATMTIYEALNHTFAVGEWFIAGIWVQAATPANGPMAPPFRFSTTRATVTFNKATAVQPQPLTTIQGNGEWQWYSIAAKVTSVTGNPGTFDFQLLCDATHPTNFYAPIALNIPAGTISDNEAKGLSLHLQPWSNAATVGEVSTLQSHVFTALGGLKSAKFFKLNRTAPTFGATVNIDASFGNEFDITVTNATAFTITNPTNPLDGQRITITVRNTSGRAMGAITWGAKYKLAAWTNPATANSRSIDFRYDGVNWVEIGRTPNDVPN